MPEFQLPGSADAKLMEQWDSILRTCQQERINFEKTWHENMAFYFGRQWITTQSVSNGFALVDTLPKEAWRVRHTANRILRIIRTEITKLSKEEPQFYCLPKSTEESDRLAALAGDSISEFILRTKYFNHKRLMATFWACVCGTAYLKNYYDHNALELDGLPGKIGFEAVTPFHLFVKNLQCTEMEEQPFVIHARTMDPETVFNFYDVDLPPATESNSVIDSRYLSALGLKSGKEAATRQCYVKEVYVKPNKTFPNGAMFIYGEGRMLYVYERSEQDVIDTMESPLDMSSLMRGEQLTLPVGTPTELPTPVGSNKGMELSQEDSYVAPQEYSHEYSYRHGRFPFVKVDHIPTGMWYAESVIKSLKSPQKEYNRTRSIMLENRNMAGKPQWSFVSGAFDVRKFNSKPGLMLAINMGFEPPKPLEQPPLPPNVSNELEVILRDMDDISSQYEITKGRTPPGVEAASAIAYLSEENDTILHHTVVSLENAVQETGIQVLANVHDYWPAERVVRMTSKNQYMEVKEFTKQDLNPIMDFRIEPGSMAPRSLAAKQAFITELMKMGLPLEMGLKYLQMSETNKLYEEMMVDNRHAIRENVYMSQGQALFKIDPEGQPPVDEMGMPQMGPDGMPMPAYKMANQQDPYTGEDMIDQTTGQPIQYQVTTNPFDNHEVHIEEHQKFQKMQEYEMLDPKIQAIIQDHVDEHKMELLKEHSAAVADEQANGPVGTEPSRGQEGTMENVGQPSPNGATAPV